MTREFINGRVDEFHQHIDTDGNIINASDGGIIYADGCYHWYGQMLQAKPFAGKGEGGQVTVQGVGMYKSSDLVSWEYEGVILPCSSDRDSPLYAPMRFERPKIIYNEKTKKYVLWCHYVRCPGDHGFEYGQAEALCAVSGRVNGLYELECITRPIDDNGFVRDSTVFQDDDGKAYFIYDRQISRQWHKVLEPFERCLHIVRLTDDYTGFTGEYARIDACDKREAPCMVKKGEYYYLITSGLTGWDYNPAKYARSRHPMHGWEDMGDPFTGDSERTSFRTQGTFIFKTREGRDIYMCERHNTGDFLRCSYIWFPIEYEGGMLRLEYKERFAL
ncbi:MAG: family 43 glycosylhydrolase [Clostridia bacterium]|nr:family 43 glycosylhydrolase [Clostridia bacterium]